MNTSDVFVGYHLVCLVDILGQSAKLAAWETIPSGPDRAAQITPALKQTVGTVKMIGQAFRDFFEQFDNHPPMNLPGVSPQMTEQWAQNRKCKLSVQQFSDTFVFHTPIANAQGNLSIEAIYRSIAACAMILGYALGGKTAVRGAICVGTGLELEPGNFYGPALALAHHLESKEADYPRILISRELVGIIRHNTDWHGNPAINTLCKDLAKHVMTLIHTDSDGKSAIDFLGEGFRTLVGEQNPLMAEMIRQAFAFVETELARFRKAGDQKHARRYQSLHGYMQSRRRFWTNV